MSASKIEWTDATWNPIVGCSIVSPGCTNCYAMSMAARIQKMNRTGGSGSDYVNHYDGTTQSSKAGPVWTGKVALARDQLFFKPLHTHKPTTWFVNSMGDLFHESIPDEWIDRVFAVMALCPQHTFQVLTKRAERMRAYCNSRNAVIRIYHIVCDLVTGGDADGILIAPGIDPAVAPPGERIYLDAWPLPNVWLGVSAERQQEADERIPLLLQTPAAVRFVSCEPLLGPIDLTDITWPKARPRFPETDDISDGRSALHLVEGARLDWVIAGGESGHHARPSHPNWYRSLRDQCAAAGVPFFLKQFGEWQAVYDRDQDDPDWRQCHKTSPDGGRSGRYLNHAGGWGFHGERVVYVKRVGKKKAGRTLDGVVHDAFPEVRR